MGKEKIESCLKGMDTALMQMMSAHRLWVSSHSEAERQLVAFKKARFECLQEELEKQSLGLCSVEHPPWITLSEEPDLNIRYRENLGIFSKEKLELVYSVVYPESLLKDGKSEEELVREYEVLEQLCPYHQVDRSNLRRDRKGNLAVSLVGKLRETLIIGADVDPDKIKYLKIPLPNFLPEEIYVYFGLRKPPIIPKYSSLPENKQPLKI